MSSTQNATSWLSPRRWKNDPAKKPVATMFVSPWSAVMSRSLLFGAVSL